MGKYGNNLPMYIKMSLNLYRYIDVVLSKNYFDNIVFLVRYIAIAQTIQPYNINILTNHMLAIHGFELQM